MRNKLVIAFGCLLLLAAITIPAAADEWNKKTIITFSQPVEIPGQVLAPGTYVFKLLNSSSNRNIVVVYNAEENHCFGIILAINNYRLFPTGEPVLKFAEQENNKPEALRAWFYSNDNWGQEFVYPKKRATQLAETTNGPVLSTAAKPAETPEELDRSAGCGRRAREGGGRDRRSNSASGGATCARAGCGSRGGARACSRASQDREPGAPDLFDGSVRAGSGRHAATISQTRFLIERSAYRGSRK